MNVQRSKIYTKGGAITRIKFDQQEATAFSGLVIFQEFFRKIGLKEKIDGCFSHTSAPNYKHSTVVMCLIIHLLLGARRLRDLDWYKNDPMVGRVLGLQQLPSVATVSRRLSEVDDVGVKGLSILSKETCLQSITQYEIPRVTLDFDGSATVTKRHAEGTAVGFNKKKKGARSYYPLMCTVAQTGQVLDVLHRSGNIHDSNGAAEFMLDCIQTIRKVKPGCIIEVRADSAFFSDEIIAMLDAAKVQYTISVPFERLTELKEIIYSRRRWSSISADQCGFSRHWRPDCWKVPHNFLFIRKKVAVQSKKPLQLDLFEPKEYGFDYKVIITNKRVSIQSAVMFHEGRGSQEKIFGEMKSQMALEYIPCKKWNANKVFLLANVLTYNLTRQLQMEKSEPAKVNNPSRSTLWVFKEIDTLRKSFILVAGRITNLHGKRTLTLNAVGRAKAFFLNYVPQLAG